MKVYKRHIAFVKRRLKKAIRISLRKFHKVLKALHHHTAKRPHAYLLVRWNWYKKWHGWGPHKHVHFSILSAYLVFVGILVMMSYIKVQAASDLIDNFDFATPSNYSFDAGIETSGTSARLKAQNYTSDANTMALFHLDETIGSVASDSSANANNGAITGTSSWMVGSLNNALSLNGSNALVSVADSASTSLGQSNTLEAWTKFSSNFSAGSHDHKQGVIDKGAYKLYYDQESGKITYELANAGATTWTQQAGNDIKGSWDLNGKLAVNTSVYVGTDLYVGLGNAVGDAEVWKWDGTTWSQVGGDGFNNSWAGLTYENVTKITSNGTVLYAGLGSTAGDAEVWSCETATGCTSWTKIGGDGINAGWAVNTFEEVDSMSVMGGNLYVGLGTTANDSRVYRWNGSSWAWVGGFGIGAPYNAFTTGYEAVYSMTNDGTSLYVGFGATAGDADVWKLTGTTWTQIGGDTLNSSWPSATIESVLSMQYAGSTLYVGLGTTAGDGDVWSYDGAVWTQIGGDTLNSSWPASTYEGVYGFASDGTNLYAGLGLTAGDNEVWRWNGTAWAQIGGDALNGSFTNTHTIVQTLTWGGTSLFAGIQAASRNAEMWEWNGTAWTQIGGSYINNSWGFYNLQNIESMTIYGDNLYAGTGNTVAGNALVWQFNGTSWQVVGGQGLNNSWAANTFENVMSMVSSGGKLYVGLGTTANDAEVWQYNGSTWTKIGGDSLNSGWATNFEEVYTLATLGTNLYAGLGNSANDAEVWRWNGTAWAKVGGDGVNSSWNTVYEQVESLLAFNGKLYAGTGNSTGDAEVWEYDGTTWSKVGGDNVNGSWTDGQYEVVKSLVVYNGRLYAGLGSTAGDGEVWEYDGTTWSKVGGGNVNSSWAPNSIETVRSFSVYKGKLYAGLGDSANVDASIWSYGNNGFLQSVSTTQNTDWHHIAATYNGTTMKLFIDGIENAQTDISLTMPDNNINLLVGSTYGTSEAGLSQGYFSGSLDEVRISNSVRTSFITLPYATTPQGIVLGDAVRENGVQYWDNFATNETANGGSITYRISDDDGTSWKYWDGSTWVVSASAAQANSAAVIAPNIATFPVTFYGIKWQALLSGDGTQQVTLNSVTLASDADIDPPSINASAVRGYKSNGGTEINSNDWTNGASPYFSWTPGVDVDAGIKGYCLYIGTDNTADPATTKGMLGVSPVYTANLCQFIVPGNSVDLSTPSYLSTALTTSTSPYYLRIKAIDNAGNLFGSAVQFQFRFDNTPPTNPGFITSPSGFINTKNATLTWPVASGQIADDSGSGVAGLQYRINNSTWYGDSHSGTGDISDLLTNDGSYSTLPTPDYININEGINTIYFRTWDTAGNVTPSYVTAALKVNTAGAPSEPQNVQTSPSTNTTNAFSFSWDPPVTFIGDENNLTYCYTFNTLPSLNTCTFTTGGVTALGSGPYATQPGANTIYVVAKDESSNINYSSFTSTVFTANTPSPGIPTNTDIVDVSIKSTNNWRLAITWDAPTYIGAGIASYKLYRSTDNVSFNFVGSSSSTTYIDAGLSQQTYHYKVVACDSTNNCGADSTVVSLLPTGKFTTPAVLTSNPSASNLTTKKALITWVTDRASDSKIAIGTSSGQYGSSEIGNSTQTTLHTLQLDNLSAGTTYYYVARWTDEDGNTGISQEFTFITSPAPVIKEVISYNIGLSSASISFTSKNASKVNLYYGLTDSFGGIRSINTSQNESNYTFNLDNLTDGSKYFYRISAFDSEGGEYLGNVFSLTTPARPRISNLKFQPIAGEPTSTQSVTWTTNVASTSQVSYGKVGGNALDVQISALTTEHEIKISGLEDDSDYFIIAQSRDASGNLAISDRQQFKTALDTRPPNITNISVEPSIRGTGAEARGQVVVSWQTDEPSTSQVAYGEGSDVSDFNSRTAEDGTLTTEHVVIVSDLPTSRVYSVQPVSSDRSRNAGQGKTQSTIIGRASDSVLTIILSTMKGVFGL